MIFSAKIQLIWCMQENVNGEDQKWYYFITVLIVTFSLEHYFILNTTLTLSVRTEYIYFVASQATSPAPFKYLFNKYPY
jgi:hypothetical protein